MKGFVLRVYLKGEWCVPVQVIVSSPGSPSSEESPEPVNKGLGGLGFANSETTEQITPTSSVDTEEGNSAHPEEGERGVEGDAEASDDDKVR